MVSEVWCTGLVAPRLWNLPGLGIEPLSSALAGGFLTTGPPGKSSMEVFDVLLWAVPGTKQMLRTSCQVSGQMQSPHFPR